MEWNDLTSSPLSVALKTKTLPHPTSANFDDSKWREAIEEIGEPTQRDRDLAAAAIRYGHEVSSLRQYCIPAMTEGYSRQQLTTLLVAVMNQQFLNLRQILLQKHKEKGRRGGMLDFERMQQTPVSNFGGQDMTADDHAAYLVDSIPHWLFHILQAPEDGVRDGIEDAGRFASSACSIASVEHGLRQLWHNVLWCGSGLRKENGEVIDFPRDKYITERWFVWDLRQSMLQMFEHGVDAAAQMVSNGKLPPVEPVNAKTVIRMERTPRGNRKFFIGQAIGRKPQQRAHVSEQELLERLYTGLFLDEELPKAGLASLTCRELCRAWWALVDLARVASDDLGDVGLLRDAAVESFSMSLRVQDLVDVISAALAIDAARARAIIDWLTCDPSNTTRLFAKSFWSEPLLADHTGDYRHLFLAPLLVGSSVKRMEAWMEKGGISDSRGIKGRGKPFEQHVRSAIRKAMRENDLLLDAAVSEHGLKRKGDSEEIDFLARIGNAIIVGEVKCFVAPSEPIERHNHLDNLAKATEQADKKLAWALKNCAAVALALGIDDEERLAALTFHPVVILNNGMGIGLERCGVPVVDLHYLELLLGSGSYNKGARFERGVGVDFVSGFLYGDQAELERELPELLRNPPPMKRFDGQVGWRRIPFPTSSGSPFFIEIPTLIEEQLAPAASIASLTTGMIAMAATSPAAPRSRASPRPRA